MGGNSPRLRPSSHNVENSLDDLGMYALRVRRQNVGSFARIWGVVNCAPLLVCKQYASEQFTPTTHGLNQLEFAYEDPGYALSS